MSKTFERHKAAILANEVGPTFIRGVKCAMNNADRKAQGLSTGRAFSGMSRDELDILLDMVRSRPPRIAAVQAAKGLKFLQSRRVQRLLGERDRAIVRDFDHFTLADWYDAGNACSFMIPIYAVHSKGWRWFTYVAGSWQSGGLFEVLNEGDTP